MLLGGILNRTIFAELVRVFLLALAGLTGMFLLAGLVQQASQLGLSPAQVLRAIPLFIPSTLPYTIPATTLFASCVVYGRLAHDNEVVAVKGAGVHMYRVLRPALLLGVLTAAVTAWLYHTTIPQTQQLLQRQVLEDPEEMLYNTLRRERCIRHNNFDYVLYVRDVQGRRLVDVVLKRRAKVNNPDGTQTYAGYDLITWAREGRLRVEDGKLHFDLERPSVIGQNSRGVAPSSGPISYDLPENLTGKDVKGRPMALTWDELPGRVTELRLERKRLEEKRAEARRLGEHETDPNTRKLRQAEDRHYQSQIDNATRNLRNVESEYWMRPALAGGCLVFALIGCPVGIWANRADYLSTFVICFLPTVFVYYPLLLAGSNMGKDGKLPLGLGCWLANIVVGTAGLLLTWRLLRR